MRFAAVFMSSGVATVSPDSRDASARFGVTRPARGSKVRTSAASACSSINAFPIGKHAGLDGVHVYGLHDGVELGSEKIDGNLMDGPHLPWVLRRESGDHGHAVAAETGDRFEVGLDASPSTRVRASYREYVFFHIDILRRW